MENEIKMKKKFYKKWWFWIIIIVVLAGLAGASEENSNTTQTVSNTKQEETSIEYVSISVDDLMDSLKNNAAVAKDNYNGKYVELKGRLNVIDSDMKYIGIYSINDPYDIVGVSCYIKNNEQKEVVKTLSTGDIITVKGKITDVGEVLGYWLNITEIVK